MSQDLRVGAMIRVAGSRGTLIECRVKWITRCRSCEARAVMVRTPAGERMLIDYPQDGQPIVSHFATCPHAAGWRKPRTLR